MIEQSINDTGLLSAVKSLTESVQGIKLPPMIYISNEESDVAPPTECIRLMKPADPNTLFNATVKLITGNENISSEKIETIGDPSAVRVLMVDDNALNRDVAANFMELIGINADFAENGFEAVRMAEKNVYDVIFMDVMMPELDGYKASRMIRENGLNTDTPIYAMTASVIDEDNLRLKSSLITGSISKPFKLPEMTKAITESLVLKNKNNCSAMTHDITGYVDFETGISNFGGNKLLYKKAVHDFIDHCGNPDNLIKHVMQQDTDAMRAFILSMQSFAENLALVPLLTSAEIVQRYVIAEFFIVVYEVDEILAVIYLRLDYLYRDR